MKKSVPKKRIRLSVVIIAVFLALSVILTVADRTTGSRIWNDIYTGAGLGKAAYLDDTKIIFADVGQGDCTIIMSKGKTAIIDSGPYSASDDLVTYLRTMGISDIDYLIVTHPHEDHMGSFADVIEMLGAKCIIMNDARPDGDSDSLAFNRLQETISAKEVERIIPALNMKIDVGEVGIEIIGPLDEFSANENNQSLILRVSAKSLTCLIMGDAEEDSEELLIDKYGTSLKSDVLKAGHHGSKTSTGDALLGAADPDYVVFSAGKNNIFEHPADEVVSRVHSYGCRIFRTDYNGNIVFMSDDDGTNIKTDH